MFFFTHTYIPTYLYTYLSTYLPIYPPTYILPTYIPTNLPTVRLKLLASSSSLLFAVNLQYFLVQENCVFQFGGLTQSKLTVQNENKMLSSFWQNATCEKERKREESRATRRVKRITKITTLDRNNKKEREREMETKRVKMNFNREGKTQSGKTRLP